MLDGARGKSTDISFWWRLSMFFYATIYGIVAVTIFNAFWLRIEIDIKAAPA
jgi:hypothetical protein